MVTAKTLPERRRCGTRPTTCPWPRTRLLNRPPQPTADRPLSSTRYRRPAHRPDRDPAHKPHQQPSRPPTAARPAATQPADPPLPTRSHCQLASLQSSPPATAAGQPSDPQPSRQPPLSPAPPEPASQPSAVQPAGHRSAQRCRSRRASPPLPACWRPFSSPTRCGPTRWSGKSAGPAGCCSARRPAAARAAGEASLRHARARWLLVRSLRPSAWRRGACPSGRRSCGRGGLTRRRCSWPPLVVRVGPGVRLGPPGFGPVRMCGRRRGSG
jgi:hypothetical protein